MKNKTKKRIGAVITALKYGIVVLAVLLAGLLFACRRSVPLPGWCYAVNTTATSHIVFIGEKAKPLAPILEKGKQFAGDMMTVINTGYTRAGAWIDKKWTKLMKKVDPNNEYGLVDYEAAVGAVAPKRHKAQNVKKKTESSASKASATASR